VDVKMDSPDARRIAELAAGRPIVELAYARQRTTGVIAVAWRDGAAIRLCAHGCGLDTLPAELDAVPDVLRGLALGKLDLRWNPLRARPGWLDELAAGGCLVYE
jgi:hypothetical protein